MVNAFLHNQSDNRLTFFRHTSNHMLILFNLTVTRIPSPFSSLPPFSYPVSISLRIFFPPASSSLPILTPFSPPPLPQLPPSSLSPIKMMPLPSSSQSRASTSSITLTVQTLSFPSSLVPTTTNSASSFSLSRICTWTFYIKRYA